MKDINEVVISDSCYGEYIEIDKIPFEDIPKKNVLKFIINQIKELDDLKGVFKYLITETYYDSDYKNLGDCDQCGSWNSKTTYKMKE